MSGGEGGMSPRRRFRSSFAEIVCPGLAIGFLWILSSSCAVDRGELGPLERGTDGAVTDLAVLKPDPEAGTELPSPPGGIEGGIGGGGEAEKSADSDAGATFIGAGGTGGNPGNGCSPASCSTGCCAAEVCVTATSARECGRGGNACVRCAACERCDPEGFCGLDPASHWGLTAVSAIVDPRKLDGSLWDEMNDDLDGVLPDPLVQLEVPRDNFIGRASAWTDTTVPDWNESLQTILPSVLASALLPGAEPWLLWVGDRDSSSGAEVMCEIDTLDAADFSAGGLTRTDVGSCIALTIRLTCQP